MKQIVMTGPRKSTVVDVPIPKCGENQLLVKVTYTGICHSECRLWDIAKGGETFGHETVGVVAEVGKNVSGFKVGDRVTGLGDGGYREYILMEPHKTCHVPDNLKDEDAMVEPLACLMSAAIKMMPEKPGDPIAVVGCGYMGLGMISLFKLCGYGKIVAVDKRPEALENAKKFGATECYFPQDIPEKYILNWQTMRGKLDLSRDGTNAMLFATGLPNVMEFAGTEDGLRLAGDLVCAHGRLGVGGFHNEPRDNETPPERSVCFSLWNFKAFTLINCHERRIIYEAGLCQRCLDLLGSSQWKFTGLTTHFYNMEEFDKGNEDMISHRDNFIKGAVRC